MIYLRIKAQNKVKIQQDGRHRKAQKSGLATFQKQKIILKTLRTIKVEHNNMNKTFKHTRNTCTR